MNKKVKHQQPVFPIHPPRGIDRQMQLVFTLGPNGCPVLSDAGPLGGLARLRDAKAEMDRTVREPRHIARQRDPHKPAVQHLAVLHRHQPCVIGQGPLTHPIRPADRLRRIGHDAADLIHQTVLQRLQEIGARGRYLGPAMGTRRGKGDPPVIGAHDNALCAILFDVQVMLCRFGQGGLTQGGEIDAGQFGLCSVIRHGPPPVAVRAAPRPARSAAMPQARRHRPHQKRNRNQDARR